MNWIYTINMANTENLSAIVGSFNSSQVYTANGNGGTVHRTFTRSGTKSGTLNVQQTKSGYNPNSKDFAVNKGTSNVTLDDMMPTTDPLETFYIDAGTTTRNASIVIKDGTATVATLTADASGYIAARTIDWQLDTGKDLTLQYSAPNADGENVTKVDVDDEEHVNIAYLLNVQFPISITDRPGSKLERYIIGGDGQRHRQR